jgi:type I restriction enzyme S subunit
MIADLEPYPKYKDSGSRWLLNVPTHWEVRNLRTLIQPRNERNRADLPLLSVAREKGVFVRSLTNAGENHNVIPEDLSNYKVARTGNLVINKMKAWQGSMGIAPVDGIVSPAYFVFDFAIENRAFGQALLRSKPYVAHFGQASDGVRVGQWDLTIPGMRQIPVLAPPPDEQAAIVRFLDWANGRLERAIRAKRKVIALLNEQKQAIIHRAVTRGLDPAVPLKPSGIPWLGDIPQHWEVSRVKTEFHCLNTQRVPLNSVERGAMTSPKYDYYGASGVIDKVDDYLFDGELLLMAEDGANLVLRNLPLAIIAKGKYWVNNHAHILKPKRGSIVYFAHVLETLNYAPWISGAAQPKLTQDRLMSISIAVPSPEEQESIVLRTSEQTRPLVTAISRLERKMELLREYRTRLVADVVTGKLDVREAPERLPDEARPDIIEDDPDLNDETETEGEEAMT